MSTLTVPYVIERTARGDRSYDVFSRLLLDLSQETSNGAIEKPLTHQTIAQMIGASRETVSRAMKDFQDAGWIAVERRRIRVADRPALERRSQVRV